MLPPRGGRVAAWRGWPIVFPGFGLELTAVRHQAPDIWACFSAYSWVLGASTLGP